MAGAEVVGTEVVGLEVVGAAVVGPEVVGDKAVGIEVVGARVVGGWVGERVGDLVSGDSVGGNVSATREFKRPTLASQATSLTL